MFDFSTGYCNNGGYAGIGSRRVSKFVTEKQAIFAFCMTLHGFKLFSGGADGSDSGFEYGAKLAYDFLCKIDNSLPSGDYDRVMQIYLPWPGFNLRSGSGYAVPKNTSKSMAHAQQFHSNWLGLSDAAKQLMARNSHQVLGSDLRTPVSFVICHTSDGATHASATTARTGGTGQAIRVASANAIAVCNTGNPSHNLRIEAKIRNASQIILERFGIEPSQYVREKMHSHMPFKLSKEPFVKSLVDGQFDIMIHGSNCQNAMGSGIAKVIKSNFKEAWLADCSTIKGDYKKLGKTTYANVVRGPSSFVVVNAYTQFKWGREKKLHCDYNAIRKSLAEVSATFPDGKILLPKIGCGLANGCWVSVSNIISQQLIGRDVTILQ